MSEADAVAVVGVCAAGVLTLKIVLDAIGRFVAARLERKASGQLASVENRLEQLSIAVDSIAVELERQGELQRFSARLITDPRTAAGVAGPPAPTAKSIARPITPH